MRVPFNSAAFTTSSGLAVGANAQVTVRREDTAALATLSADADGLVPLANPFNADSAGQFTFYAVGLAEGYEVTVVSGADTRTLHNVAMGNVQYSDATALALSLLAVETAAEARALLEIADASDSSAALDNAALAATCSNNQLTVTLKARTQAGSPLSNDISASNPVTLSLRSATATDGTPTDAEITSPLSHIAQQGSLYGATNGAPFRLWVVVMPNNSGGYQLCLINCVSTAAGGGSGRDVVEHYELRHDAFASAVAEAGSPSGEADSAGVFYGDVAVSSKPYAIVGYIEFGEQTGSPTVMGLPVAGVWSVQPTKVHTYVPGTALPGEIVRSRRFTTGDLATGTTVWGVITGLPQKSWGDQYMANVFTVRSPVNVLEVKMSGTLAFNQAGNPGVAMAVFQDEIANALKVKAGLQNTANVPLEFLIHHKAVAAISAGGTTSFKARGGSPSAGTCSFNGSNGSQLGGGVQNSFLEVIERQA